MHLLTTHQVALYIVGAVGILLVFVLVGVLVNRRSERNISGNKDDGEK